MVLVNRRSEYHPEGSYYLLHQKKWTQAGDTPQDAVKNFVSLSKGTPVVQVVMLDEAIDQYLSNGIRRPRTLQAYTHSLKQFYACVGNKPLADISKQDLIRFADCLKRDGASDRTVANRVANVVGFLRHNGIKNVTLRVKYVEKKVKAYRDDELKKLFSACDRDEWLLFQFFLCSGCRDQEVMHADRSDIDFVDGIFTVRTKSDFKPKDYEEREIPLPDFLLAALKDKPEGLLFPTAKGHQGRHMLRKLQTVVKRAGLSGEWGLHKFRKSYATVQHNDGVSARTIQKRLGHSSLETTLRYLEGEEARSELSRQQVNGAFAQYA
jgi:integrase/recombinase XerD